MAATGADGAAAFIHAKSPGASNCAQLAERAGIPTLRYLADWGGQFNWASYDGR